MEAFDTLLTLALDEDLGTDGDVTSRAIFGEEMGRARLYSKDHGVLAGIPYFEKTYARIAPEVKVKFFVEDGDPLSPGDEVAVVEGPVVSILEGERTAINFLSFLSGIATSSASYARAAKSGNALVLDTRKTLPGYRTLSKYAVAVGGATNHRMGLYDMVMIKDNHADAAGSIAAAVQKVRDAWGDRFRVEVETRNLDEVQQAMDAGADIIMLDNMSEELCAEAVALGAGKSVVFEASGNMDLDRVESYSPVGVDYISVGALTHSVDAFDFSLRMDRDEG